MLRFTLDFLMLLAGLTALASALVWLDAIANY